MLGKISHKVVGLYVYNYSMCLLLNFNLSYFKSLEQGFLMKILLQIHNSENREEHTPRIGNGIYETELRALDSKEFVQKKNNGCLTVIWQRH